MKPVEKVRESRSSEWCTEIVKTQGFYKCTHGAGELLFYYNMNQFDEPCTRDDMKECPFVCEVRYE